MGRRRAWRVWRLGLRALPARALAAGCTRSSQASPQRGTAVVAFVDFSASVGGNDRVAFKRQIEKQILPWLQPGASFLLAPIHDKTLTEFRPLVEGELPPPAQFNGWRNNVIKSNRQAKETEARFVQVKEKPPTRP